MERELVRTIKKDEFRLDFYRGSGAGGQHRNKTDSACRITHIESGLSAQSEDQRSQKQNRATAFRRLVEKMRPMLEEEAGIEKRGRQSTPTIRTYHSKRGTVKDHRTGKIYPLSDVLEGEMVQDMVEDTLKILSRGTLSRRGGPS